jgi:hypothetical protein
MSAPSDPSHPTVALSTKLEEDFVSPVTAVRGALEILRDFPDLTVAERERFVATALEACTRLEKGIDHLALTVYAAGERAIDESSNTAAPRDDDPGALNPDYSARIRVLDDQETIEVDFGDFEFSNSKIVNDFYDVLDHRLEALGGRYYFIVNYRNCSIWPEAWVAFAHRGKRVNVLYSLGMARYAEVSSADRDSSTAASVDPDLFESRDRALAHIQALRRSSGAR